MKREKKKEKRKEIDSRLGWDRYTNWLAFLEQVWQRWRPSSSWPSSDWRWGFFSFPFKSSLITQKKRTETFRTVSAIVSFCDSGNDWISTDRYQKGSDILCFFFLLLLLFHSCRTNIDRLLWVLLEPDVHRSFQSGYGDLFIIYQMYWEKTLGPTTTRGMKATCFPNGTLYVCVFRGYHLLGAADCHPSKAHTSHIPVDENRPVRPANVNLFITKSPHWLAIDLFFYHTHTQFPYASYSTWERKSRALHLHANWVRVVFVLPSSLS